MTAAAAPAIGYSVVANLGGDRQLTCQCFVGEDETDAAVNAKIDRIFAVVDRQKARYEIVDVKEDLAKHRETLHQLEEDLARIDADFDKAQASLDEQAAQISADGEAAFSAGYEAHVSSGRRGDYAPSGQTLQKVKLAEAATRQVLDEKAKNTAERDQHRASALITVERYKKAIIEREAKLASLTTLLGG